MEIIMYQANSSEACDQQELQVNTMDFSTHDMPKVYLVARYT